MLEFEILRKKIRETIKYHNNTNNVDVNNTYFNGTINNTEMNNYTLESNKKISNYINDISTTAGNMQKTRSTDNSKNNNLNSASKNNKILLNLNDNRKYYRTVGIKSIKKEFVNDVERNIANFSPKIMNNKLPYKSQTENIILLKFNLLTDSNLNNLTEKSALLSNRKKTMTKSRLELENKNLQNFIKSNKTKFDETKIKQKLHLPMPNKNYLLKVEYEVNRKKIEKIPNQLNLEIKNTTEWKKFEYDNKNPSLGPEYIKNKFKNIYKHANKVITYNNSFKRNFVTKTLNTALFANRIIEEDDSNKYENVKNTKLTQISKMKMKWKTIKWIIENRKDVLDRLMEFHENLLKISNTKFNKYDKGFTKSEFIGIMKNNGITNDLSLINKLFWVFDENGDKELRYQEIVFGIEMFRESSLEQKLKAFFELCDVDKSGTVSKSEFYNLLKKNMINNDEKVSMKNIVDKIFHSVKLNENGEITYEGLKDGCEQNKEISQIIYKNFLALKTIDSIIDRDIQNDITKFNPELNEVLRRRLMSGGMCYIPLRDKKFDKLLDNFIDNKQKQMENKKNILFRQDDSLIENSD